MTTGSALIADASPLFREGLRHLLRQSRFVICAEGRTMAEAMEQLDGEVNLDLIICALDAEAAQPNLAGVTDLRGHYPKAKIIIIADKTIAPSIWREAFHRSDAILSRDVSSKVLQRSIELVMLEQKFFFAQLLEVLSPNYTTALSPASPLLAERWYVPNALVEAAPTPRAAVQLAPASTEGPASADIDMSLSDRERQILKCLIRGHSNKVIARELNIAEATVKVHVKGLLRKLRATNRTQAAIWALNNVVILNGNEVLAAQ